VDPGGLEPGLSGFMGQAAAVLAFQKGGTLLNRKEGDEKKGQIMVHPLELGLPETAGGTSTRR